MTQGQLNRTRQLMNAHVRDSLVTGFEHLIPSINLPDPGDRHVAATAIHLSKKYSASRFIHKPPSPICLEFHPSKQLKTAQNATSSSHRGQNWRKTGRFRVFLHGKSG